MTDRILRLALLSLFAPVLVLSGCSSSGNGDDDDDDIVVVDDDDDSTGTVDDDDDDDDTVTPDDDDDDTTGEIVERSIVVTLYITFYWSEDSAAPITPEPTATALAGPVPFWEQDANAMRLTPVLEGLPDGTAFPLGARWEIRMDPALAAPFSSLLADGIARITDADGEQFLYEIWDNVDRYVIPVEHFTRFAVLLNAGRLEGALGDPGFMAWLTGFINGGRWATPAGGAANQPLVNTSGSHPSS